MESPETSIHSARSAAARRSRRAVTSGPSVWLGDLALSLSADDATSLDSMRLLLDGAPVADVPADIVVAGQPEPPASIPDREPDEAYVDLRLWRHGGRLVAQHHDGTVAVADADGIVVGPHVARRTLRRLFQPMIAHVLGMHGRWVLHGAGVVDDGAGVLALGRPGAGKSTFSTGALVAGLPLLGDDLMVLRSGEDGLELAGVPKQVAVPPELGAHLAGLTELPDDPRRRLAVPADRLDRSWHPLTRIVCLEHADGRGFVEPRRGPLVTLAVSSFPAAGDPGLLRAFLPVAAALARLPWWRWAHDEDEKRRVTRFGELLARTRAPESARG